METTAFGSTNNVNAISTKAAFCDQWNHRRENATIWEKEEINKRGGPRSDLACLDDIVREIEGDAGGDPWESFPQLKTLLKDRVDWDSDFSSVQVIHEKCRLKERSPCADRDTENLTVAEHIQTGELFRRFSEIWHEEGDPMGDKHRQLSKSFWETPLPNILNRTWE